MKDPAEVPDPPERPKERTAVLRRTLTMAALACVRPGRVREIRAADARQYWSPDRLRSFQAERLGGILRFVSRHVPFYRELLPPTEEIIPTHAFEILATLPTISKQDLIASPERFVSPDRARYGMQSRTGGSTGTVLDFHHDRRASTVRWVADARSRTWTGWRYGETVAKLWGHQGDFGVERRLYARLRNALLEPTMMVDVSDLGTRQARNIITRLGASRPPLLIGYASALAYLASEILRQELSRPPLLGIISTAESLEPPQRSRIEQAFRCPIYDRYGSREMGMVAQQCHPAGPLHLLEDRHVVELRRRDGRECAPGEVGEIILTDLHNRVMPFLRYRTGDLGVLSGTSCGCGRGFRGLDEIRGRRSDVLVGLEGRVCSTPGPTFWTEGVRGIHQLQFHQHRHGHLEIWVVPTEAWSEDSPDQLRARVQQFLGELEVDIVLKDSIPISPSGKHRFVVSEIAP